MGAKHTCALKADHNVVCWGGGLVGALGRNGFLDSATPVAVSASLPPGRTLRIDAGSDFSCAVADTGNAYCWGANLFGQLGDGTTIGEFVPVKVTALTGAASISTGESYTCAALVGGGMSCWGSNLHAQLGAPVAGASATPVSLCQ